MTTRTLQTLIDNTPPRVLRDARRMADAEVADHPEVCARRAELDRLNAEQAAARDRADGFRALLDALPERRRQAEAAADAAERTGVEAAKAALCGDDHAFHEACDALRRARDGIELVDLGAVALTADYEALRRDSGRIGSRISDLEAELSDVLFAAKIALIHERNASR